MALFEYTLISIEEFFDNNFSNYKQVFPRILLFTAHHKMHVIEIIFRDK